MSGGDYTVCGSDYWCHFFRVYWVFLYVSLPLYVIVLISCYKCRSQFVNRFSAIIISAGIADIWYVLQTLTVYNAAEYFWFNELPKTNLIATLSHFGMWYVYFCQIIGVFNITLSRYISLLYPFSKFWSKKNAALAIIAQWVLPLPLGIPMLLSRDFESHFDCIIAPNANNDNVSQAPIGNYDLYPVFNSKRVNLAYANADLVLELGFFLPAFMFMYVRMCIKMVVQAKRAKTNVVSVTAFDASRDANGRRGRSAVNIAARRMTLMSVFICFTYTLLALIVTYWAFEAYELVPWNKNVDRTFDVVYYLFSVQTCYLLLALCKKVRDTTKAIITCSRLNALEN